MRCTFFCQDLISRGSLSHSSLSPQVFNPPSPWKSCSLPEEEPLISIPVCSRRGGNYNSLLLQTYSHSFSPVNSPVLPCVASLHGGGAEGLKAAGWYPTPQTSVMELAQISCLNQPHNAVDSTLHWKKGKQSSVFTLKVWKHAQRPSPTLRQSDINSISVFTVHTDTTNHCGLNPMSQIPSSDFPFRYPAGGKSLMTHWELSFTATRWKLRRTKQKEVRLRTEPDPFTATQNQ